MSLEQIMPRLAVAARLWRMRPGLALGLLLGLLSPITEAAPTVFLTSPPMANTIQYLAPATFNVSANVTPSARTSITQVEFYQGTTLIGTTSASPHTIVQASLPAGTYSFTVKATDSAGGVTTSTARNVTVNASNKPPTVSLGSPGDNAQYQAPANVTLSAGAQGIELNTPITQIEFLDGTTVIATVTAMPYTVVWANPPAGVHHLTVRATDSGGAVTTSAARTITVTATGVKLYYLHSDHLDTPRLVTDEQNKVVWRNTPLSEPFGMSPPEEDPDGDGQAFTMNLRFPGQYADRETNTNYNYFRDHYFPDLGRYGQSDPIGLNGGINTYSYVDGDPVGSSDIEGLSKSRGSATPYPSQYQSIASATAQVYLTQIRQLNPNYPPTLSAPGGPQWSPVMLRQLQQTLVQLKQQQGQICTASYVLTAGGQRLPVPQSSVLVPTFNGFGQITGSALIGGPGGNGLAGNVTALRLMYPNAIYSTGYANYLAGSQSVSPTTGSSIAPSNPSWHIPNLFLGQQ